ncbi:gamma-BHC dehydrochlorinase [Pseudonocardia sp. CNS-139]|nr:gamma-BHC dehydrochlorinase [Pseudonocardia sp. CNS-139]
MSRIADRFEIQDCLFRYARAVDRLDYDAIADCYFPDAIDVHGGYTGDVAGLVADIRARHQVVESAQHFITNVLVEFVSADVAHVESYCLCYFRNVGEPDEPARTQFITRCRYVDRFERRDGRWAIADRVVVFDESVSQQVVDLSRGDWVLSRRDRHDPVYRHRETSA